MTDLLGAEAERMVTVYDLKHATPARYVGRHVARRRRLVTRLALVATVALVAGMTAGGAAPPATVTHAPVCAHGLAGGFGPACPVPAPGVWL